jgi:hypothetical protein
MLLLNQFVERISSLYVFACLYELALFVLLFRSLYYLPVGAFVATPAKDLLHPDCYVIE